MMFVCLGTGKQAIVVSLEIASDFVEFLAIFEADSAQYTPKTTQSIEVARDGLRGFTKGNICSLEVKALGTVPGTGTRTGYGGTRTQRFFCRTVQLC